MADPVALTPEQKAAIQAFAQKYPDFDFGTFSNVNPLGFGNDAAAMARDPQSAQKLRDFALLKQQLGPALAGAHFTAGGDIEQNRAWWKQALLAAGVVAAPALAYAALPAAAAAPEVSITSTPVATAGMTAPGVVAAAPGGGAGVAGAAGADSAIHKMAGAIASHPNAAGAITSGIFGFLGNLLGNRNNNAFVREQAGLNRRQSLATSLAGADADQSNQDLVRQQAYMNTFQQDPVHQQKELFRAGVLNQLAQRGAPQIGPGYQSSLDLSGPSQQFLNPNALAENASRFYGAAGALNPSAQHTDLSASFGAAGQPYQAGMDSAINDAAARMEALRRQRRADLLNGIDDPGTRAAFGDDDYFTRKTLQTGDISPKGFRG